MKYNCFGGKPSRAESHTSQSITPYAQYDLTNAANERESAATTILSYSRIAVCQAFLERYPNPYATHVLSEDILYREVNGTGLFRRARGFSAKEPAALRYRARFRKSANERTAHRALLFLYAFSRMTAYSFHERSSLGISIRYLNPTSAILARVRR